MNLERDSDIPVADKAEQSFICLELIVVDGEPTQVVF
jgi:hypothetical protein